MSEPKSFHSVCRWSLHAGKGGFVPSDAIPDWKGLDTPGAIRVIAEEIRPRLPAHVELGVEMHYDYEFDERNAAEVADALAEAGLHLALTTPGAHRHFAYGGVASLDPKERAAAEAYGVRALELTYGPLRKAWHPDPAKAPVFVLWNGSFGYDLATVAVREMYRNLKESVAALCREEERLGGKIWIAIEPKPNEGHPAMLLPTVASALLFWRKLEEEHGIPRARKGVNKEFGHSEMIGLDPVYDTVEELDDKAVVHMHLNSQGWSDGIVLGGPGKFDVDHGVRVNGMTVAIAGLVGEAGYARWKGHDLQPRPYDGARQAADRVVRSILSWEACARAARDLDVRRLLDLLAQRETAQAEDLVRGAVADAQRAFDEMIGTGRRSKVSSRKSKVK
ncbi:MAG: xylose isomerase [Planctomycetes bacterium]|nr:xylose isomerase [Planctomycetota bacterium]